MSDFIFIYLAIVKRVPVECCGVLAIVRLSNTVLSVTDNLSGDDFCLFLLDKIIGQHMHTTKSKEFVEEKKRIPKCLPKKI